MKLFVYGTLRRGEAGHHLLGGAPFCCEARTAPSYELVMLDGYPALCEGGGTAVVGEIYAIPADLLPVLDEYEDVPRLYQRRVLRIAGEQCWVYILPRDRARGRRVIASGDWRRR